MKKKLTARLSLNRETLRTLSARENQQVNGGVTAFCTSGTSSPTDACGTVGAGCNSAACETANC